LNMLYKI